MRFPLAMDGLPCVLTLLVLSVLLMFLQFHIAAATVFTVCLFVGAFFRDPERNVRSEGGALLSPADGRIISVTELKPSEDCQRPDTRVSVFMSIFNCHVNRSPVTGAVANVQHTAGRFLAAFAEHAGEVNERTAIEIVDDFGESILCTQVAGLIARRIVCRVKGGDRVEAGQRIGMIKFGSRVDVVMPSTYSVCVNVGDRVKAGLDVIGHRRTGN